MFFGRASRPDSQDTFEQFLNVQTLGFLKLGGWALRRRVTSLALSKFVDVCCFAAHSWLRYKTTKRFGVDGGEAAVAGAVQTLDETY